MVKLNFQLKRMKVDNYAALVQSAIRPAAQAGAQIFYDEVCARVDQIGRKTGNLRQAIYQKFVEERSTPERAVYHISWRKAVGEAANENNRRSGLAVAPHGHLVEYGHIQRYQSVLNKKGRLAGQWTTLVRPEMRGKPRPKRRASQAVKDAYYVLRKGGDLQVPAKPFLRPSFDTKQKAALAAAKEIMQQRLKGTRK